MKSLRLILAAFALPACATLPAAQPAPIATTIDAASAESRTRASLEAIEELNPRLNAVLAVDPEALAQAQALDQSDHERGPLFGMPVLVKDNIDTAGSLPTTAGSLALAENVTNRDSPLVARLRRAGAIIIGKANLSEWANIRSSHSISGWSALGGQTRNPYFLDRNPCGSSSGSAVAVAASMVPAAIGTETDGSITCPASVNGIVGFKPTVGLISRTHIIPISHSQDTPGPMTRTVRDAALLLAVMAGSDPADPATADADRRRRDYAAFLHADSLRGARIGVMRFATGFGTDALFDEALDRLRSAGAVLVEIEQFPGRPEISRNELIVLLAELKAGLNDYLATTPATVATRTLADLIAFNRDHAAIEMPLFGQDLFEKAEETSLDEAYRKARSASFRMAGPEGIDRLLLEHEVVALVGPTMPAAWLIDAVHGDQLPGGGAGGLAAVAGYPHLTVPMGTVRGLPVGLSFIGPKWSDDLILSLGYAFEQASDLSLAPQLLPSVEEDREVLLHLRPVPTGQIGLRQ